MKINLFSARMGEANRENVSDEAQGRREMGGSKEKNNNNNKEKKKTNLLKDATQYNHLS